MSRLLHAAARGARIQGRWIDDTPQWHTVRKVFLAEDLPYQRIHPEDAHLQYGQISTALREVALTNDCDGADIPYIEVTLLREEGHFNSTEEQRCVFLLILAEALADEGM